MVKKKDCVCVCARAPACACVRAHGYHKYIFVQTILEPVSITCTHLNTHTHTHSTIPSGGQPLTPPLTRAVWEQLEARCHQPQMAMAVVVVLTGSGQMGNARPMKFFFSLSLSLLFFCTYNHPNNAMFPSWASRTDIMPTTRCGNNKGIYSTNPRLE